MRRIPLVVGLIVMTSTAVVAQDRPPLTPTRDVTITYKVMGRAASEQGARTVRISHAAGNGLMRVDTPEMGGYAIIDRARKRSTMVMERMRIYMEVDASKAPVGNAGMPEDNARFARKGTDRVAGQPCTVWDVTTPKGDGAACITTDGAMLRYLTRAGEGMEATAVSYGAIPAASFTVPAGFQKMEMPGAIPGMVPGGMPSGGSIPPGSIPPGSIPPGMIPPGMAPRPR